MFTLTRNALVLLTYTLVLNTFLSVNNVTASEEPQTKNPGIIITSYNNVNGATDIIAVTENFRTVSKFTDGKWYEFYRRCRTSTKGNFWIHTSNNPFELIANVAQDVHTTIYLKLSDADAVAIVNQITQLKKINIFMFTADRCTVQKFDDIRLLIN